MKAPRTIALLLLVGCGGAPFTVGDLSTAPDAGTEPTTIEAAAPLPDAGSPDDAASRVDTGAVERDAQPIAVVDSGVPIEASADAPVAAPDAGQVDAGGDAASEAGAVDPITYACGSGHTNDGAPPVAPTAWWASVSVQQIGGAYVESYCTQMSLGPGIAPPTPYTCEGIAAVWDCAHWLATGGNLGCRLNGSVLQVDCWEP